MPKLLEDTFRRIAVIGAAGKMGRGIALLLLQEMACREAEATGMVGSGGFVLVLVDTNPNALFSLKKYLKTQILKFAEKNINTLRKYYEDDETLVSNEEIIHAFVDGSLDCIKLESDFAEVKDVNLVFEAIVEDVRAKEALYTTLATSSHQARYYFTNTSSIPISLLDSSCKLGHKIIGFHFYNPAAIQKLVEIIPTQNVDPNLHLMALELAKKLQKITVESKDVPGFIGNGYFIREVCFACAQARKLAQEQSISLAEAIFLINRVTGEYLLRPMGIFQVIDYVGIDVCKNIAGIMSAYLPEPSLHDDLLDKMVEEKLVGGQYLDGLQKEGFFQYVGSSVDKVYSLKDKTYIKAEGRILKGEPGLTWKHLQSDPEKEEKILDYLVDLEKRNDLAARLAKDFLSNLLNICERLVETRVARSLADVDMVLQYGFYHSYGAELLKNKKVAPL